MEIDKTTVEKIAHLARLELTENEKETMQHDLSEILTFMEKLNEIDTSKVEPLIYMSETENVFREDVAEQHFTREEILKNAPNKTEEFFKVASVIPSKK